MSTTELRSRYNDARPAIQRAVAAATSRMPRVLIDATPGRLHGRTQQAEAFEALPVFSELVSSMTARVDEAGIWKDVKEFYQYVMLSHKWQNGEPLFQDVKHCTE